MKLKKPCAVLLIVAHAAVSLQSAADEPSGAVLPDIGDPTGTLMTPQQETELGSAFFRSLHGRMEINQDPEVLDYIQSIGEKLTGSSEGPSQSYTFFVVNQHVINAFAGPGGYIGVNSGLILLTDEESELASVLAHEIAHVTQRHLYQTFQAASRLAIPTALAMLGAALLGARGGGQAGAAAMMAAQAASTQYQINFTRDNEAEADRVGMQILSKSAFDPRSMPTFFERMQQSTRFAGNRIPEFLLTHPVTVSRISDTRDRAEKFAYRQVADSMGYQIVKAKLRVQTNPNPRSAIDYFKVMGGQGTRVQQDVNSYGLALAFIRSNRYDEAKAILQRLVAAYPNQSQFVNALAETEMEMKNFGKALQLYDGALQRFPDNRALTLNFIRALLLAEKPKEARKLLNDYTRHHPATPEVHELMARAYSEMGNDAESHRYVAEAYYAAGQTRSAILQMQMAKKLAGDNFYLHAVVDERLSAWRAEERDRREDR
jgi:predicted Zn-dependent protease